MLWLQFYFGLIWHGSSAKEWLRPFDGKSIGRNTGSQKRDDFGSRASKSMAVLSIYRSLCLDQWVSGFNRVLIAYPISVFA